MMPTRSRTSRTTTSKVSASGGGSSVMEARESSSFKRMRTEESSTPVVSISRKTTYMSSGGATSTSASAGDGASGSGFGSSVTMTRSSRSRSPLMIKRLEEKEEIAGLNDRLAEYIDYVRHLDVKNKELKRKYKSVSQIDVSEIDKIKGMFEDEIESLRHALDLMAKDKAALEVENRKMKAEWEEMKAKLARKEMELRALERKMEQYEKDLADARLSSERYSSLRREYDQVVRQVDEMKKALEQESTTRSEFEAKIKGLNAELDFQAKLYRQEKAEWYSRKVEIEEEVEDRAKADYESKLAIELAMMREQTAEDMRAYKLQIDGLFGTKFAELKDMSEASLSSASRSRDEVLTFRRRLDEVNAELAKKQAEVESLMSRVRDLEKMLEDERHDFEAQTRMYREQNASLRLEMQKRFEEFNELMAVKIALDQEIMAYRKLLESEEVRCHLSHEEGRIIVTKGAHSSRSHQHAEDLDEEELADVELASRASYGSAAEYSVKTSTSGPIEIVGCDGSGQFVTVKNGSSSDVVVGGWQLRYVADGKETLYKFPRQLTVKAGDSCTVWSSETHTTHEPPHNLVMKGLTFFKGDKIQIYLSDKEHEMAVCEMSKESRRAATTTYSSHSRRAYTHEERAGSEERCSVM